MVSSDLSLVEKGELSDWLKKDEIRGKCEIAEETLSAQIVHETDIAEKHIVAIDSAFENFHAERVPASEVHLLDLSLEGSSFPLANGSLLTDPYGFLGCFVLYSLPDLVKEQDMMTMDEGADMKHLITSERAVKEEGTLLRREYCLKKTEEDIAKGETHQLWWDSECAVLNGRARHTFECIPFTHPVACSSEDAHAYIHPTGIIFSLVSADSEGSLSAPQDRTVFATCHLPCSTLLEVLSKSTTQTVSLPITFTLGQAAYMRTPLTEQCVFDGTSNSLATSAVNHSLTLTLSHRLQPVLYRSVDIRPDTQVPVDVWDAAPVAPTLISLPPISGTNHEYSIDPADVLSPYEKLKRGLFSWEEEQKRAVKQAAVIPPSILPTEESARETSGDMGGTMSGIGASGSSFSTGIPMTVTVGKVSNWPRSLLCHHSVLRSTESILSSSRLSETTSHETNAGGRQGMFMFCVVELNIPQREEV